MTRGCTTMPRQSELGTTVKSLPVTPSVTTVMEVMSVPPMGAVKVRVRGACYSKINGAEVDGAAGGEALREGRPPNPPKRASSISKRLERRKRERTAASEIRGWLE